MVIASINKYLDCFSQLHIYTTFQNRNKDNLIKILLYNFMIFDYIYNFFKIFLGQAKI